MSSLTFVITGTLSRPRDYFKDLLESQGHKVASSVTNKTDYVLCGRDAGSKWDKAADLGVEIISEGELGAALALAGRSSKRAPPPAGPATRTIYHFRTDDLGEVEGMFDEDYRLLDTWCLNDAHWRQEYMAGFLSKLGVIVKPLPAHRTNAAIEAISDHMGLGDDFGD